MLKKLLFLALIVSLAIGCLIPIKPVFSFEGTRSYSNEACYIAYDKRNPSFQFLYTHSIHLSNVKEFYRVKQDLSIQAIAMEYEDVAIGMPGFAEKGQSLIVEDGLYRLTYNEEKIFNEVTIHISNISSMQHFFYKETTYDLKKLLVKGASYHFSLKKISIFQSWKEGCEKND